MIAAGHHVFGLCNIGLFLCCVTMSISRFPFWPDTDGIIQVDSELTYRII